LAARIKRAATEANGELGLLDKTKASAIAMALNPLIGYLVAAELVEEEMAQNRSIRELVLEIAATSNLLYKDLQRPVTIQEVE
jgi:fumarate hydratase class II